MRAKMTADFDELVVAQLDNAKSGSYLTNTPLRTGGRKTGGALSAAEHNTDRAIGSGQQSSGEALSKGSAKAAGELNASAKHVGKSLRKATGSRGRFHFLQHVLNAYQSASDTIERRAEYERRYGRYEGIPQPRLTSTHLHVEIYPERRKADIRGTYRLVNRSAVAIDSSQSTHCNSASRCLSSRVGSINSGVDASVVANGTYFKNLNWLPAIGYQPSRELENAGERRAHGLALRPAFASFDDDEAHRIRADVEKTAFDAVVGTDQDQIAVAPGTLRRTWTESGRRYFHYLADAPITTEYALYSADYAVHEGQWNDVAIRIFHHPGHAENVDRMMRSVRASLDYNSKQLGPYPYRSIKVVEHAGHGLGMHADAGTTDYEEGFSLINPRDPARGLDLVFYVVSHEVAHQWWGHNSHPRMSRELAL